MTYAITLIRCHASRHYFLKSVKLKENSKLKLLLRIDLFVDIEASLLFRKRYAPTLTNDLCIYTSILPPTHKNLYFLARSLK